MTNLKTRRENHQKVSQEIAKMQQEGTLSKFLEGSQQVHSGIGGTAVKLEIAGVPIFAKRLAASDLEMEHQGSTKNLFNLPTYYQYGVGSAGFSVWRELESHKLTTSWVLNDECPNFPLMYGSAILPKEKKPPMTPEEEEFLDIDRHYWGDSQEVRNRLEAIHNSSNEVIVFLESIPQTLDSLLHPKSRETAKIDTKKLEQDIKSTTAFMESKGMIHFDAHGRNILSDGENLYFADFGLTTSLDFDLSEEEKKFIEQNKGYDRSLASASLTWHHPDNMPLLKEVQEVSEKYQESANIMNDFMTKLRFDQTKQTQFPAKELLEAFNEVDRQQPTLETSETSEPRSPSQEAESFVRKLGFDPKKAKKESFVERMQDGKYGNIRSQGGANEL